MRIYGVDFTSVPGRRKPITCACGVFAGGELRVAAVDAFEGWPEFERFLATPGPWVCGFDFPFGQPRRVVEALGWPATWEGATAAAARLDAVALDAAFARWRARRRPGERLAFRPTDRLAGAASPMMMVRVPVGRMWLAGAPRLAAAGLSILPCRPNGDRRVALEVYPALEARALIGRRSYKAEGAAGRRDPARAAARAALVRALRSRAGATRRGFRVRLAPPAAAAARADSSGDRLDAVLAAVAAARGWLARRRGWGIPPGADPLEGWIVGCPASR